MLEMRWRHIQPVAAINKSQIICRDEVQDDEWSLAPLKPSIFLTWRALTFHSRHTACQDWGVFVVGFKLGFVQGDDSSSLRRICAGLSQSDYDIG